MSEKITYGIKNVYVAPINVSESGVVTYGVPRALPGATEIALSIVGEIVKKYADNITYFKMGVNQGYEGNLSVYNVPDWFSEAYLGYKVDSNGVLVEDASGTMADFALMFEFNTDTAKTKRNVMYNVTASRPEINSSTKEDTIDPQPFSIPITASPAIGTEYVKASVVGDSTDATWSSWFSSVYTIAETTQQKVTVNVKNSTKAIANALVVCGGKIAHTDSSGNADFMLPSGTYDVLVSASGYTAQASNVTVASSAVSKVITMAV